MKITMTKEEITAYLAQERDQAREGYAAAKRLEKTHPAVSYQLRREIWEPREIFAKELLRRLPTMEPDDVAEIAEHIQQERQQLDRVRSFSDRELVQGYLQDLWRDRKLMKAAKADGLDLLGLAALLGKHRPKIADTAK